MQHPHLDTPVSSLRQRLIDDMNMRRFSRETQRNYLRDIGRLAAFLGRSPDTATADDLRRFQIEQQEDGVPVPTMNSIVSALRFFFTHTLDRPDLARRLVRLAHPRNLPVVLSRDEVARLLNATTCLKHQAALSVAYGAGLRVAEVSMLKVADVDSERMLLRVERGKGGRYRNAMLSADLLALLREWWKVGRQQGVMHRDGWLFPGQHAMKPISTRQLYRIVVEAAQATDIAKRVGPHTLRHSFATHLLEDGTDIRIIQVLLGHAKLNSTALYAKVATKTVRTVTSPLDKLGLFKPGDLARRLSRARLDRGRRHLPSRRACLSGRTCRAPEPHPAQGHVGNRALPYCSARRSRRGLRGLWPVADRLQLLPQPALPEVPGRGGADVACRARGRPLAGRLLPRRVHAARRGRRHRLTQQGARLRPAVQGGVGDDDDDCRRSQAPRRAHRHHRRTPHLGIGDDPPSARAHDRARRRHCVGWKPLDLLASGTTVCWPAPPARPVSRSPANSWASSSRPAPAAPTTGMTSARRAAAVADA